jgi:hypothetical protein
MARERTIINQTNNIVYVEPNYTNSVNEYGVHGLEAYEFAPDLEDYSIFVNLEVETVGRTIQTGNKVYRFSYVSKNGGESVNLMGGSKIYTSDGNYMNTLTTNWTDYHISNLRNEGASPELFGINYIDIAYNHFMVPEVTIEFVDIRGAAVFGQKEEYEANNIERALGNEHNEDVVNTFFQCFFTFPYPKFSLLVKGFYGQPVAYELTCADFRARFNSEDGNFSCTAKFVGFHFSFLNDVMVNALVAAPYSDYEGAKYWEQRGFTFEGYNGGEVAIPKLAELLKKIKHVEAVAEHVSQSSPEVQEKNNIEQITQRYTEIKNLYTTYLERISNLVKDKKDASGEIDLFISDMDSDKISEAAIILVPSSAESETFASHFEDNNSIHNAYNDLVNCVNSFKESYPSSNLTAENLPDFSEATQKQRIFENGNNRCHYIIDKNNTNDDIKNDCSHLYRTFEKKVLNQNKDNVVNKYSGFTYAYYYYDKGFTRALNDAMKEASDREKEVVKTIERNKNDELARSLGWYPTVENITKIMMAHFETFVHMIHQTALSINAEKPQRDTKKIGLTDDDDLADVPEAYRSSETHCLLVPPFPNVTKIVEKNGIRNREESWVGDYGNMFREVDLVHGILNGIEEFVKTANAGDTTGSAGSTTNLKAVMKYPLSPLDFILTDSVYGDFDQSEPSALLGLVGLRALQILGTPINPNWKMYPEVLGKAEAENLLKTEKVQPNFKSMLKTVLDNGVEDVITMLEGKENGGISKPTSGIWPWQEDTRSVGIVAEAGGSAGAERLLEFNICKLSGVNGKVTYALPLQNLGWSKIKKEIIHTKSAASSNDYFNISDSIITNCYKDNILYIDTNINRIKEIADSQLVGLDGIEKFNSMIKDGAVYNKSDYDDYFKSDHYEDLIAYPIKDAANLLPKTESCMIPCTTNYIPEMSWGGGFNLNYFHDEDCGGDWYDKNGNKVQRTNANGYDDFLTNPDTKSFTLTEIPGLKSNFEPTTDTSLFTQLIYYKADNDYVKAFYFLTSLSYLYDYEDIFEDEICSDDETTSIIPLPAVMYAGALIWMSEHNYNMSDYEDAEDRLEDLYKLDGQVRLKLRKLFEQWVTKGIPNNNIIVSFREIKNNLEIKLKRSDMTYEKFFKGLGEVEDKGFFGIKRSWFNEGVFENKGYKGMLDLFAGELGESFFRNYICVDEDLGGSGDFIGMRVGNRDGSPGIKQCVDFALAPCLFMKTTKFFFKDTEKTLKVNRGFVVRFFKAFLERITEDAPEQTTDNSVSQAKETETTVDIKVGVYRYCKLIYDKWIGGMPQDEFSQFTMEKFFAGDDRYFYFIDAYYNTANDILINIGDFCKLVEESYISADYSLLSLLSSIYSHNQFNFFCVQNFLDLGNRDNMIKMFDTIPYTEHWDVKRHPNFIVNYAYEPSSHLDLDNAEYENDSFMINMPESRRNKWPEAMKSRSWGKTEGFSIPAFGVSYGKMYQSYFKDVSVSMDNPTVTEQSIKAQFAIASLNNETMNKEDDTTQYYYGQDLYAIYSNNSYTCEVTMMGCAWVQPLMLFVLNNVPMFRGTYQIINVTHHIEQGEMVTKFKGVRMANVTTRLVEDSSVRRKSDQTDAGENTSLNEESRMTALASTDNDCPYPVFPTILNPEIDDLANLQLSSKGEMENAKLTVAAFVQMGYTDIAGAAVAGNIMQETHYVPRYVNKMAKASHNPGMKGGLCQWQLDRLTHLVRWDMDATGNITSEEPMPCFGKQLMFIDKECNEVSYYSTTLNALKAATTDDKLDSTTETFRANYEGGSEPEARKKFAKQILEEYRQNPLQRENSKIVNKESEKVSALGWGFLHALNKSSMSSSVRVEVGIDENKCSGDTIYLTNAKNSSDFGKIFDIMLNAYSDKIEEIKWLVDPSGAQNMPPTAYIVSLKEGMAQYTTKITVADGNSLNNIEGLSLSNEGGGMNSDFKKALVKHYKSEDNSKFLIRNLQPRPNEEEVNAMFKDIEITKCNDLVNGGSTSESNVEGPFNTSWDVEAFVKNLHYWQRNICEAKGKKRSTSPTYNGCGACTGAINRALNATGFKYNFVTYPWELYEILKSRSGEMMEISSGEGPITSTFGKPEESQKGDICVMWTPEGKRNKNTGFHSCAFDGQNWISDFVQNRCNIYSNSKKFSGITWYIFRHK